MENTNVGRYLQILRRRLWLILLLFAVTMTVILVTSLTAKPIYQSAVRLQVIPVETEQVALYSSMQSAADDEVELINYQFDQLVRSTKIAWRTITQVGVEMDARELLDMLSTIQEYGFITVVAGAYTPEDAEAIVTAQVQNALDSYRTDQSRPAVVTGEFINEQLAVAEQDLAAARAELLRFKVGHALDSLSREINSYQDIVRSLRIRQSDAALAEAELAAQISALQQEAAREEGLAVVAEDGAAAAAEKRANDLRAVANGLQGDIAGVRASKAEYDRLIAQWETELTSLIGLSEEYSRLENAVARIQSTRDFLFNKSLEARLKQSQGLSVGYLQVIEPARRPETPLPSRTLQMALVGGILSLVAGAVIAFLLELVESSARSSRPRATS